MGSKYKFWRDLYKFLNGNLIFQDDYFREEPLPTQDVFGTYPIPYPKREFLTDDDNEDKSESKSRNQSNVSRQDMNNGQNDGQPSNKRVIYIYFCFILEWYFVTAFFSL